MSLRSLPSVDRLAAELDAPHRAGRDRRGAGGDRRAAGGAARGRDAARSTWSRARSERVARLEQRSLRRVLNATGVIVHTNLGRAPLAADAQAAVARIADGYSNLEWDVETGARGSRHDHVAALLTELTGAEAAMAVNNCAAAVLLAAAALAGPGRDIVVSRGQLVEIGGGFRIPEVVAQAGARLVEVGTTNRTRRADYERAIGPATGAILRAHPSNFRQLGFVQEVEIEELCELGAPVIDDVGSGNLAEDLPALADEPPVRRSVKAGAALVCFSGDKLLGGPQAGRARRPRGGDRRRPSAPARPRAAARQALARRARGDARALPRAGARAGRDPGAGDADRRRGRAGRPRPPARRGHRRGARRSSPSSAKVGGGALPLLELPGPVVAVAGPPDALAARLRAADPPVVGRIQDDRLLLDPRTLAEEEIELVAAAVRAALS